MFLESGSDSTFDTSFFTTTSGTFSSDSTPLGFPGGPRSIKCTVGSAGAVALVGTGNNVLADAGRRISVWVRFEALPAVGPGIFIAIDQASGADDILVLALTSTGKLQLQEVHSGSVVNTTNGLTTLTVGTVYQIGISYTITDSTHYTAKVTLNGVLEISRINNAGGVTMNVGSSQLLFAAASFDNNKSVWFKHIYVDDGATLDYPGNVLVTAKRPFANGTTNGFTTQIGSSGSGYGTGHAPQVNERPLSQTNGWAMIGAGASVPEEYNVESISVGDVNLMGATIIDWVAWVFAKALASETGSLIYGGNTVAIALTSTPTLFTVARGAASYPPGAGADVGIMTTTALTTVSLYECGIMVAYIPPPVPRVTTALRNVAIGHRPYPFRPGVAR